ncbi:DmX-like protein 1 [Strongyloides ratti]|uniref:DmX-like protein 1 n=1 Tax=Strongyloides ratti TaxID=34506 RepID=A0A090MP87_STRRB|nr:DmX-like protein 1 [Strongyloides ratti]CEF59911.1 DmX-like protein 1 [Strongyloides ratti]
MVPHQVITGAINIKHSPYSVGYKNGLPFIASCVGRDLVILDKDLNRIQLISNTFLDEDKRSARISAINCCQESGKIISVYGTTIALFEPKIGDSRDNELDMKDEWKLVRKFESKDTVKAISWALEGNRIILATDSELKILQARPNKQNQNVNFTIDYEHDNSTKYDLLWKQTISSPIRSISVSSDSMFFATCGKNETIVKIWYQVPSDNNINSFYSGNFSFTQLAHPDVVTGFEWRAVSKDVPRKGIQNAIITYCKDNVSRIWKENVINDLFYLDISGESGEFSCVDKIIKKRSVFKNFGIKGLKLKMLNKIGKLVSEKKKMSGKNFHFNICSNSGSTQDLMSNTIQSSNVTFYLTTSLDVENDSTICRSLSNKKLKLSKPLTIHWLNNKEIIFNMGFEKILMDSLKELNESIFNDESKIKKTDLLNIEETTPEKENSKKSLSVPSPFQTDLYSPSVSSENFICKDSLDLKLNKLLSEWKNESDILYAIHPVDGSLITWNLLNLDSTENKIDNKLISRTPNVFPVADASTIKSEIHTFRHHNNTLLMEILQKTITQTDKVPISDDNSETLSDRSSTPITNDKILEAANKKFNDTKEITLKKVLGLNSLSVLTSHDNGTLNLWKMSLEENSNFKTISHVRHVVRMCGHRYDVSEIVPHPTLPLAITTSKNTNDGLKNSEENGESELILWKISPVGQLAINGGISELARINSRCSNCFEKTAWIPHVITSSNMGILSPSSCFISSVDGKLEIFQCIIDARKILSKMQQPVDDNCKKEKERKLSITSENETKYSIITDDFSDDKKCSSSDEENEEHFNDNNKSNNYFDINNTGIDNEDNLEKILVSTQSASKPGCIGLIKILEDSEHDPNDIILLHVFTPHSLAYKNNDKEIYKTKNSNTFYVLFVLKNPIDPLKQIWKIWSINIKTDDAKNLPNDFYTYSTAFSVNITSNLVYEKNFNINNDDTLELISLQPMADHLPSSNLYPACQPPFLLIGNCNDNTLHFYKIIVEDKNDSYIFDCIEESMVGGEDSFIYIDGKIISSKAANGERFAIGYSSFNKMYISVYECESTGGVNWRLEDSFLLRTYDKECKLQTTGSAVLLSNNDENVKLDWVSMEDGGYILTTSFRNEILFYTYMSYDLAQQNVITMQDPTEMGKGHLVRQPSVNPTQFKMSLQKTHWICIRHLELHSVNCRKPQPTAVSWVRDGFLVVGMPSELLVYHQWNFNNVEKPELKNNINKLLDKEKQEMTLSRSSAMFDQLHKATFTDKSGQSSMKKIVSKIFNEADFENEIINSGKNKNLVEEIKDNDTNNIFKLINDVGIFEAGRLVNPMLPQYHPKQLIDMLNAGQLGCVEAILVNVLQEIRRNKNPPLKKLKRKTSVRIRRKDNRKLSLSNEDDMFNVDISDKETVALKDETLDYDEIEGFAPIPLHELLKNQNIKCSMIDNVEDSTNISKPTLENQVSFNEPLSSIVDSEKKYDDLFDEPTGVYQESIHSDDFNILDSSDEDDIEDEEEEEKEKENKVEDNEIIENETNNIKNMYNINESQPKFTKSDNEELTTFLMHSHLPGLSSSDQIQLLAIADTICYINSKGSYNNMDTCGVKFSIGFKQHSFLMNGQSKLNKEIIKKKGLSTAIMAWAFHSESENELLNEVLLSLGSQYDWNDLKSYGIGWWVKNSANLKICFEKLAQQAFQKNNDPMDASLYYLVLRKRNVIAGLFRNKNEHSKATFFSTECKTDKERSFAQRNAFSCISKGQFENAAAIFLLTNDIRNAIKVIVERLNDIQLALVVARIYILQKDEQDAIIKELILKHVLGITENELEMWHSKGKLRDASEFSDPIAYSKDALKDPFVRSMGFFLIKEYFLSAHTLLMEAKLNINFEAAIGGGEETERSLPDIYNLFVYLRNHTLVSLQRINISGLRTKADTWEMSEWYKRVITVSERRLYFRTVHIHLTSGCPFLALNILITLPKNIESVVADSSCLSDTFSMKYLNKNLSTNKTSFWSGNDQFIQKMTFISCLKMFIDEISNVKCNVSIGGANMRFEVLKLIENDINVLKKLCQYNITSTNINNFSNYNNNLQQTDTLTKVRTQFLISHQNIIRSFASYCALYSSHKQSLTSVQIELLLLLLEVQQGDYFLRLTKDDNEYKFPLLSASCSPAKMAAQTPISFIEEQNNDIMATLLSLVNPPIIGEGISDAINMLSIAQGLSTCLFQVLSDLDVQKIVKDNDYLNYTLINCLSKIKFPSIDRDVNTLPSKWPGVTNLSNIINIEKDDDSPALNMLIAEVYIAINMTVFCYSLAVCDAKLLLKVIGKKLTIEDFGNVFGGGGSQVFKSISEILMNTDNTDELNKVNEEESINSDKNQLKNGEEQISTTGDKPLTVNDMRVFSTYSEIIGIRTEIDRKRSERPYIYQKNITTNSDVIIQKISSPGRLGNLYNPFYSSTKGNNSVSFESQKSFSEEPKYGWIPPKKHVLQYLFDRTIIRNGESLTADVNLDKEKIEEAKYDEFGEEITDFPHLTPYGYAWTLLRLASVKLQKKRIEEFVNLCGIDMEQISRHSSNIDNILKLLDVWQYNIELKMRSFVDGPPSNLLPNMAMDEYDKSKFVSFNEKYRSLFNEKNTPFEVVDNLSFAANNLWKFLVGTNDCTDLFVRYIYGSKIQNNTESSQHKDTIGSIGPNGVTSNWGTSKIFKIIHKEQEPIVTFAINRKNTNQIAISNGREIQELDIHSIFEEDEKENLGKTNILFNQPEIDIVLNNITSDPMKINDNYQIFVENSKNNQPFTSATTIQRVQINGVRRIESHPSKDIYITGASDGSIYLRKWNIPCPISKVREPGCYAKVTNIAFAVNGEKFAAVDGDGLLCMWQLTNEGPSMTRTFFNSRAYSKSAADVCYMGHSSSTLVTAGHGGDNESVILWDTLQKRGKMSRFLKGHPDGAVCVKYVSQNTILSAGKYGEVNIYDIRGSENPRTTVKIFDNSTVKYMTFDKSEDLLIVGSSEGDMKVFNFATNFDLRDPPLFLFTGEHHNKSGFSLRQVGNSTVQGIQKIYVDENRRIYSCGGDFSMKIRSLPRIN